jgi:hypothetical protein
MSPIHAADPISQDSRWNPWVREDRADEYKQASMVMDQWRRAEPGHRMLTTKQIEADWFRQDRERENARQRLEEERETRKALYDEERAEARLALLEQTSLVPHEVTELTQYQDETLLSKMDDTRRRERIIKLERSIAARRIEIDRLTSLVGDPGTVIDQNGWLPGERREAMLLHYRFERERRVRGLRTQIPELTATVERKDRWKVTSLQRELNALLAVPPLTADDMCSDCPVPLADHGVANHEWSVCSLAGAARPAEASTRNFGTGVREAEATTQQAPKPPKPEPLAVIPSGLPICEIMERLAQLQQQFPDAQVRRGRANRWELWPKTRDAGRFCRSGGSPV